MFILNVVELMENTFSAIKHKQRGQMNISTYCEKFILVSLPDRSLESNRENKV